MIKEGVEFSVEGVVNQTVPHRGLMNLSRLRVAYLEYLIRAVFVGTLNKVAVEFEDIVY